MSHIKDDEKKGENKVLNDISGSIKIERSKKFFEENPQCLNECSYLPGIGTSDIWFQVDGCNYIAEVKSGSGNKKTHKINMNQIRLWKGEPIILECSHSDVYNVDYCVFPANFLIRVALCGHDDFIITPLHQEDILMSASMTPNPDKASQYFGCSASELRDKVVEAQEMFEKNVEVVEIVKKMKKRIFNTVNENKEWAKALM
jgi:hypothetical protein